jgi:formylmethanofuran dehydrogenase subunit E
MKRDNFDLKQCIKEAKTFHGHICGGITIGTRMSILGMKAIGISDPKGKDRKDLLVFVEIDRCATDAILVVTGCHPGKRTMKILDYGKMAATFINLKTGKAVRIASKNTDGNKVVTREMMEQNPHSPEDFSGKTDEELFEIKEVKVTLNPEDLPGKPIRSVVCSICGERIMDAKDVIKDGKTFCKPCAENKYYYMEVK